MAVLFAPVTDVAPVVALYGEDVSIAGINGPSNTVISGRIEAVEAVVAEFEAKGVTTRRLQVSHAFHSQLMLPMLDEFESIARTISYKPPTIRLVSNVTGKIFGPDEVPDADYWRRHVMAAVQFEAGMRALDARGCQVYLEVGPHPSLIGMGRRILDDASLTWVGSLNRKESDIDMILEAVAGLYVGGIQVDWHAFYPGQHRRVRLPLYPFQHKRYWFGARPAFSQGIGLEIGQELLAARVQVIDEDGNLLVEGDRVRLARLADGREVLVLEKEEAAAKASTETEAIADIITPDLLRAVVGEKRAIMLSAYLRQQLGSVLRMAPDDIPTDQPLIYLGMDSIMAVELKNLVERELRVEVPIAELVKGPSVDELVAMIAPQLSEEPGRGIPLVPAEEEYSDYPLSYGQRAMWFQHQVSPDSIFNPTYAARVKAPLDVDRLQKRFDALFRRHPSLRTSFFAVGGEPRQRISEEIPPYFHLVNARGWDEDRLHEELKRLSTQPFNLQMGPLLRLYVFELGDDDYVFLLSAHHIVVDLWSLAVLLGELTMLWPADDPDHALPPVPIRYTDFVRWQMQMLESPVGEELWDYWQERLSGDLPLLNLPTDRPRPPVQTFRGATKTLKLGRTLSRALRTLSEQHGVTTYMTVLAAFKVLLRRYTGQDDIIVGTPTAGRTQPGLDNVVGYFVNPVPLRSDLSGNPGFADFLAQVKETVLGALAHQDYPFNLMVEKVAPERSAAYTPIFQVMFVLQRAHRLHEEGLSQFALDAEGLEMDLAGMPLTSIRIEEQKTPMDLTMLMAETGDELAASITYNTDLFEDRTITRLLRHFQMLLHQIVDEPDTPIGKLRLLTDTERRTLVIDWNHTQAPVPELYFHQLVAMSAVRRPQATAVTFKDQVLSYKQLNEQANQLAHYLRERGVGPDVPVGIMLPRSPEMIIALLGVLKAGGAYLPIDPTYPPERIRYMVTDSDIHLLLTHSEVSDQSLSLKNGDAQLSVIHLDTDWPDIAAHPHTNPDVDLSPENLAYIIYTSGSTGRPKGVLLHHYGLMNFITGQRKVYGGDSRVKVLQFASFSFDAATAEIVWALANGGSLHLAERTTLLSEKKLADLVQQQQVNAAILPPTVLKDYDPVLFPSLRTVVSAGEACTWDIVEKWLPGGRAFLNGYGPTETTIGPTGYQVRTILSTSTVPVGRPLDNVRVYLLDEFLQPVPVGVPGEIYIGGPGVARGYLNRPDITAERFLPDPYALKPGSRMYRTGDLARWLPDGNIEYLGRVDFQVKIRGFRVELGEIDNLLLRHPAVENAVTVALTDAPGGPRLVAYVVPEPAQNLTSGELRAFVEKDLPDYMIPSYFTIMEEFPLSPNGKVDRKRLPVPSADRPELATDYVPPRNDVEQKIADIWQEVLGIDRVGVHDNFFELGGHSLLLAKVNDKLESTFHQSFNMVDLFRYPTIADLAEHLSPRKQQKSSLTSEARRRAEMQRQRRRRPRPPARGGKKPS
jgi:amino acid adenylation domain-containing protein